MSKPSGKLPKVPKIPVVSVVLMLIYLFGGSFLISLTGLTRLSIGVDIAVLIVCYLSYFFIIGSAFYYAFFEKT